MYDYVIVGAGSAGCVLANRLSEDPDVSVLLLEAGGPDTNELVHLPAAFSALYRTAQDWDHSRTCEPYANDRRIYLPRGKVLGGSSSINAMIYIRGNPLDYDEWGAGWTWEEMLPYFKRAEDNERGEDDFHGVGGPLPVSDGRSRNPLAQHFIDAATAYGLPANEDFNGEQQDGVGWYQVTHRNGARASAAVGDGREPRRARGDRLRRHLQLAAAPDAVRARQAGGARGAPDRRGGGVARDGAEPARPPERGRGVGHRRGALPVRRPERGQPGPVRGGRARPAHL